MAETDEDIVKEARKRFKREQDWEGTARKNYNADIKFANGDSRNMYQWPQAARDTREATAKPCFTFNETRQKNLQITNDARQNKQAITIKPTGEGSDYKSAQIYQGVIRHIEYQSNAQTVYNSGMRSQVQGGWGYWRVVTDYATEDSFDQEIFIRRVKDTLSVYLDHSGSAVDRSDAKYGFIFENMPRDEAEKTYPKLKDRFPKHALDEHEGWVSEDDVRVCEYFRVVTESDMLVSVELPVAEGEAQRVIKAMSELQADPQFKGVKPQEMRDTLAAMGAQFRPIQRNRVQWFKIAGDLIVERRDWPGKYIPIVLIVGEETVIDGVMDRKGHTRAMIDAQMNYNYWASEAAAQVALQTKSPYLADMRSIEGFEKYWDNANIETRVYLPYNSVSDDGTELAAPRREPPAVMAQAYIDGMKFAREELRMVSGQYQSTMGAPSNETSGVAIQQRQRQGENATYHFIDHQAIAIRFTGLIILDLIPHIYDTKRVMSIMGDDGKVSEIMLDPEAEQALIEQQKDEEENVKAIFNPNVGKYDVEADVGPSFATQRQEAFNALSQIIANAPDLMKVAGDLLMRSADFPLADEMAQRLKRMVPPEALEGGPNPEVQALQQQVETMQQLAQALTGKVEELEGKLKEDQGKITVSAYDAETKRLSALKDYIPMDPQAFMALITQTIRNALETEDVTAEVDEDEMQEMQEVPQMQAPLQEAPQQPINPEMPQEPM